MMTRLLIVEA